MIDIEELNRLIEESRIIIGINNNEIDYNWIPQVGDYAIVITHYNNEHWWLNKIWKITNVEDLHNGDFRCHDTQGYLNLKNKGFRRATHNEYLNFIRGSK